ncbi:MAG TPA: hypothetical protein VGY54_14055 [Polyangiaceae bacterium]|nr:hypothetical protein [Polyangiaceae bacterium]
MGATDSGHPQPTFKQFLGGLLFGGVVKRIALEATRDEFTPEGRPPMDDRARMLLKAAEGLAGDDEWSDGDAVQELLRITGRHKRALEVAEINSRRWGDYLDLRIENRAQRLLYAALTGRPVGGPTEADERRFAAIEPFADLEPDEAWERMLTAVPRLRELQRLASEQPQLSPERREFDEWVTAEVQGLAGPSSGEHDLLLGSGYVYRFVLEWLLSCHV